MDDHLSCQLLIKQRRWSKPTRLLIWTHFYLPCTTLFQREYERLRTVVRGHKKENVKIHSYLGNSSLVKWVAVVGSALNHVPPLYCCSGSPQRWLADMKGIQGTPHPSIFMNSQNSSLSELPRSRSTRERHPNHSQLKTTFLLCRTYLSICQI